MRSLAGQNKRCRHLVTATVTGNLISTCLPPQVQGTGPGHCNLDRSSLVCLRYINSQLSYGQYLQLVTISHTLDTS